MIVHRVPGDDGTRDPEHVPDLATCGTCGRTWDDAVPTATTPAPSGRCPFEYDHTDPDADLTPARLARLAAEAPAWCAVHAVEHFADGWGPDCHRADEDTARELAGIVTFEVPVLVTVVVERRPDGTTTATVAGTDREGGPWAFSGYPAAYNATEGEWLELTYWPDVLDPDTDHDDTVAVTVSEAAYAAVTDRLAE